MRLTNGAGAKMIASGKTAEFYIGKGWQPVDEAPVKPEPAKRPARSRKASNGVDATK